MRKSTALLAGMALSALVLIGLTVTSDRSSASFTATTTNPANSFGSATLTMSNDKSAAASLINLANLVPGDTAARTVTITNTGTVGMTYTGAISAVANTLLWSDTTNGIQVTVKRRATTLFTGPLKNLALAASGTRRTWKRPRGGDQGRCHEGRSVRVRASGRCRRAGSRCR